MFFQHNLPLCFASVRFGALGHVPAFHAPVQKHESMGAFSGREGEVLVQVSKVVSLHVVLGFFRKLNS